MSKKESQEQKDVEVTSLAVSDGLMPTGWIPVDDMTFEQWSEIGKFLFDLRDASQWALGDWLNFGEAKWGEKYVQALNERRASYQTLRNVSSVCRAYALPERVASVSFSHHALVAGWERGRRAEALTVFDEQDMNRDAARAWKETQQGDEPRVLAGTIKRAMRAVSKSIEYCVDHNSVRDLLFTASSCLEDAYDELTNDTSL